MTQLLEDRFCGCLLGLAVGDALGGPVELMQPSEIAQKYNGPLREMVGGGWLHLSPGEHTDDTQLMICTAESIVAHGAFESGDVVRRYLTWYADNPKDVGGITDSAISRMKRGMSWREATYAAHLEHKGASAGNGSVMRSVPLALFRFDDPSNLMIESRECARLTHWNELSAHATSALNLVIACLLQGIEFEGAVEHMRKKVKRYGAEIVDSLERSARQTHQISTTGFVLDTLAIAWRSMLQTTTFEEAVVLAVNLGGDADAQGALVGALAGARWGAAAIPSRWLERLHSRTHIHDLGSRLLTLAIKERRARSRA